MTSEADAITIGLNEATHKELKALKDDGTFAQMADGYRFAIALAIAMGEIAPPLEKRQTIFNVGSIDPDGALRQVIGAMYPDATDPVYRTAERLAEWGVCELARRKDAGGLSLEDILVEAQELAGTKSS